MEGGWTVNDVSEADYLLLLELFNDDKKEKEEKQDPLAFFGTVLTPQDYARAKGEIS
ncbi:hypothetical protein [Enterococcus phage VEsP-2]|jgi:hypothetical protein|nr:tail tape measure chaperone protein [Enterococcus phage heks]QYS24412.1 hypothetical protein [Enterococcus phage VEsP-2]UVX34508.1 MAG: hypothetical protein [Bacteriophage sp.]